MVRTVTILNQRRGNNNVSKQRAMDIDVGGGKGGGSIYTRPFFSSVLVSSPDTTVRLITRTYLCA